MKRRIYLYVGLPLAVAFAAFGGWYLYAELSSRSGINLNHSFHGEVGATCDMCHQLNAQDPRFVSFPDHESCAVCHADALDADSEDQNCELCHNLPDYVTRVRKAQVLSPLVAFDHRRHAEAEVGCEACHPVPDQPFLTGNEMLPKMEPTCIACHDAMQVADVKDCETCHLEGWRKIAPLDHDPGWTVTHAQGLTAERVDSACRQCHTARLGNSCTQCHHQRGAQAARTQNCDLCHGKGYVQRRPRDHGAAWTVTHGKNLSRRRVEANCALCHTAASGNDCLSCHRREAPRDHNTAWTQLGHGKQARLRRESCSTCHDQSECVSCHTTNPPSSHTGLWGSPRSRHCINCHMERDNFGSSAGGLVGSNCSLCHQGSEVFAEHTSLPRPTTAGTPPQPHPYLDSCVNCHHAGGSGGAIPHPYSTSTTQCRSCHQ